MVLQPEKNSKSTVLDRVLYSQRKPEKGLWATSSDRSLGPRRTGTRHTVDGALGPKKSLGPHRTTARPVMDRAQRPASPGSRPVITRVLGPQKSSVKSVSDTVFTPGKGRRNPLC